MWEGEEHQYEGGTTPVGEQTHNPGMCPDREWTSDPLLHETIPDQLSHIGHGSFWFLKETKLKDRKTRKHRNSYGFPGGVFQAPLKSFRIWTSSQDGNTDK